MSLLRYNMSHLPIVLNFWDSRIKHNDVLKIIQMMFEDNSFTNGKYIAVINFITIACKNLPQYEESITAECELFLSTDIHEYYMMHIKKVIVQNMKEE